MEENMVKFEEKLKELIALGKKKKNILELQEINDVFSDMELEAEQMEKIFEYVEAQGIDVLRITGETEEDVPDDMEILLTAEDEDVPEDMEKIPVLERSDISREIAPIQNEELDMDGTKVVLHEIDTNGIGYVDLIFDLSGVSAEELPYVGILQAVLGIIDTDNYEYGELFNEINMHTGGISTSIEVYPDVTRVKEKEFKN